MPPDFHPAVILLPMSWNFMRKIKVERLTKVF